MVIINGKEENAEGIALAQFLSEKGYDLNRVAVECCGEIIPKSAYNTRILHHGDVIEIVSFVGGG